MKKLSLCVLASLLVCTVFAQTYKKRTPEEKAKYYTEEMAKEIKIDKEQEKKIYDINLFVSNQFDSLFASKPDADTRRKVASGIYKQRDAEFRKVLSKTQFLQYDDIQREKREKRKKENLEKEKIATDAYSNRPKVDSTSEKK